MLNFNQNQKHSKYTHNIERVSECKKLNKNIHFARLDTEKISFFSPSSNLTLSNKKRKRKKYDRKRN